MTADERKLEIDRIRAISDQITELGRHYDRQSHNHPLDFFAAELTACRINADLSTPAAIAALSHVSHSSSETLIDRTFPTAGRPTLFFFTVFCMKNAPFCCKYRLHNEFRQYKII